MDPSMSELGELHMWNMSAHPAPSPPEAQVESHPVHISPFCHLTRALAQSFFPAGPPASNVSKSSSLSLTSPRSWCCCFEVSRMPHCMHMLLLGLSVPHWPALGPLHCCLGSFPRPCASQSPHLRRGLPLDHDEGASAILPPTPLTLFRLSPFYRKWLSGSPSSLEMSLISIPWKS